MLALEDEPIFRESVPLIQMATELAIGQSKSVSDSFLGEGLRPAEVLWSPATPQLLQRNMVSFANECHKFASKDGTLTVESFNNINIDRYRDSLVIVSVGQSMFDFTYEAYGADIAAVLGRNLTGSKTTDFPELIGNYFTALYYAISVRKEVCLSIHEPPHGVFASRWYRLSIPLFGAGGEIEKIATLVLAENSLRPGMDIIPAPAILIDSDSRIIYSNKSAVVHFGRSKSTGGDLSDYIGFKLEYGSFSNSRSFVEKRKLCLSSEEQLICGHSMVRVNPVIFRSQNLKILLFEGAQTRGIWPIKT
ncbi:hypothetical protein [Litoreibacter roseus]|uniref:PAS domain-containing protein n=1 Tax=Litoreibacter roseus TaxID=2601869 RepID=A0A6N6JNY5_9RHOB|nr:hypothetical protein [Litoreibacter roseus]GFE67359.1 hypothetical protein KIN_44330 [Litoreibacter roseus]